MSNNFFRLQDKETMRNMMVPMLANGAAKLIIRLVYVAIIVTVLLAIGWVFAVGKMAAMIFVVALLSIVAGVAAAMLW